MKKKQTRRLLWSIAILILGVLGAGAAQNGSPSLPDFKDPVKPGFYKVTHINDGDTIVVLADGRKETVRMIGVDTPETKDPRKPVQCFGQAASDHTKQIIGAAGQVRLEADPANSDRDKYSRLLRYVYLPDGTLYNATLIKDGYGFAYTIFPYTKLDEFRTYESDARKAGRGLWSGCGVDDVTEVKQTKTK